MKKFLSLVLALVMAMSLVTIGAGAASFTDDSSIQYKEAVDVISALDIVEGYEGGAFQPTTTLTRGAAAKIICNLVLGPTTASALSADAAPFSDVPANHTFAGYIAYCSTQGIINGYADGTFKPAGTLTGYQFMKMLLGALGYDGTIEGFTGANWTVNVAKLALGIELNDGNDDFVGNAAVTREEACLYAFNTLKATMVEYSSSLTVNNDGTLGTINKAEDVESGKIAAIKEADCSDFDDDTLQFAEKYFTKLDAEAATDDFGAPATKWLYDNESIGKYSNTADETYVVTDAAKSIEEILTDSDYMGLDDDDFATGAVIYFNGQKIASTSTYAANKAKTDVLGKGDVIEAFENSDGDYTTFVVKSYTYAKIDAIDDDLSSTLKNKGASVEISLIDIEGNELGNGDYYDDHDDDEKVLNGFSADTYTEGTVLAVAIGEDDGIVDSYVVEAITGTPTAARAPETCDYSFANGYLGADKGLKNGSITVGGTKYNYSAQFSGIGENETVDFDEEYAVYLTKEGYVMAIDGDASVALNDVYYVAGAYAEASRGTTAYYVQAVSVIDGVEHELKLDSDYTSTSGNLAKAVKDAVTGTGSFFTNSTFAGKLWDLDEDDGVYEGTEWTKSTSLTAYTGSLTKDVTSTSSAISNGRTSYYDDSTFFISIDGVSDDIDIDTATGKMTMEKTDGNNNAVKAIVIYNKDNDAKYVIYVGKNMDGATSAADIVYLDDDANTKNNDGWEGTLWFMDSRTSSDVTMDESSAPLQGFYRYSVSDDLYDLKTLRSTDLLPAGEVTDDDDGVATGVVFDTGKSSSISTAAENVTCDGTLYYNTVQFTGATISAATVIDTRGSSAKKADAYSNTINSTTKLASALNKGYVVADVYAEDGEILFIAVTAAKNAD